MPTIGIRLNHVIYIKKKELDKCVIIISINIITSDNSITTNCIFH